MTIEEMLALDPGRELDAHIAVMVMGFKEVTIVGNHYFTDPIDTSLKEYSMDISAAWEVVEKFPYAIISRAEIFEENNYHAVEIYTDVEMGLSARVEAKTAPEAICKAALLAVLGEEEA
ncbi:hypothetical protein D1872_216930 [compost metagenome]